MLNVFMSNVMPNCLNDVLVKFSLPSNANQLYCRPCYLKPNTGANPLTAEHRNNDWNPS
jgi:hypothetical protein